MKRRLKKVAIYTDGSCRGDLNYGGWATIVIMTTRKKKTLFKIFSGNTVDTTNNRMELTAVIEGLRALKEPCEVHLFCDSEYVLSQMKKHKNSYANLDLIKRLRQAMKKHPKIITYKVKAHNGDVLNDWVDALASAETFKRITIDTRFPIKV